VIAAPFARVAVRRIDATLDPPACFARIAATRDAWLLESARPEPRLGRWSFAGAGVAAILRVRGAHVELEPRRPSDAPPLATPPCDADPFELLRTLVPAVPSAAGDAAIPFVGGAVGWLGHELAARLERVPIRTAHGIGAPDAAWLLVDRVLAVDHESGASFATALGFGATKQEADDRARRAAERLASRIAHGEADPFDAGPRDTISDVARLDAEPLRLVDADTGLVLGAHFDADSYAKAVDAIREEIRAGEVYQANLTHRLSCSFDGDAWRLYERLRARSPAPFAAYLALPELTVVGSSPERFLCLDGDGCVESRPIKGTRPRGASPEADARLAAELAASEKERAENAMIVDLVRNDLGRVCAPGSVTVSELRAVESYATVHQMVSTVTGRLRAGRDRVDLLRAAFPPGSMTGAPKIAALERIAALEPVPRGVYAGALGYLDARGGMDLAVVIRTILCRGRRAWLHVGGGVVLDSDPRAEWEETLAKARAMIGALAASQERPPS
jgi:para-aminobenzoate synthetase component 1